MDSLTQADGVPDAFGQDVDTEPAKGVQKLAAYPANTFYTSDPEEVRCYAKCLHQVPSTIMGNLQTQHLGLHALCVGCIVFSPRDDGQS